MKSCLKITTRLTEAATIWKNNVLSMAAKTLTEIIHEREQDHWDKTILQVKNAVVKPILQTISAWQLIPFQ